ncbi:hypothetical protein [Salibacterium aidingense]|uniref:hypothetical protein n=1 Tax=Salibacterium aidingense TaxID=384933 RepID=UPI000412496B|nr:hypothetical protein [Salibacterium aidingense]
MFETEEIMINHLLDIYDNKFVYKEIGSGYGVADVVIVKNKAAFKEFSQERAGRHLQTNDQIKVFLYMRNKRQGITFEDLYNNHFLSKRNLKQNILRYLISIKALMYIDGLYYRNMDFKLFPIDCIALEGKLTNWYSGLVQAIRYKKFAKKSYVAIDENYAHRANVELFKEQNIGLLTIGSKINVVFSPKIEQPLDPIMRYRISENLIKINHYSNPRALREI